MVDINKWEDWDELEEQYAEENMRDKITHKPKTHDSEEWGKLNKKLQKESMDKYVKNKHRDGHKNNRIDRKKTK